MGRPLVIWQDEREKTPLIFPKHIVGLCQNCDPVYRKAETTQVIVEVHTLPTADYGAFGFFNKVLIERKKHLSEIARNVLTRIGRRRFVAECQRLRDSCQFPHFLIEGGMSSLLRDYQPIKDESPWLAYDALERLALEYGVRTLYLPSTSVAQRRVVGEQAAHLLLNGVMTHDSSRRSTNVSPLEHELPHSRVG